MTTQVIVRADDVTGAGLVELADWFEDHHPAVPCSVFAVATHREWSTHAWHRARRLIEDGWEVGGHTRTHPKLSLLSDAEIRTAITENITDIEAGLADAGIEYSVESFAYPCGDYDERVVDALRESGIQYGLTYPDGFPYTSVDSLPSGEERYRWGVTNHAAFDVDVWNNRFDRVHGDDGLYVLCIHPERWMAGLFAPLTQMVDGKRSAGSAVKELGRRVLRESMTDKWTMLDEHLGYIEEQDDVEFTTFRDAPH